MSNQKFGEGRGKSIAALSREHNRLVSMGRRPQVEAAPIAVRLHHNPILAQREEEKDLAGRIGFKNMRGPGKTIGLADLRGEGKWRCITCKQANETDMEACKRCGDPKKAMVEKRLPA